MSTGGFGSDPGPKAGRVARLKFGTATVLPRLTTSRRTRPLHRARSTGSRMETSASHVTRPCASTSMRLQSTVPIPSPSAVRSMYTSSDADTTSSIVRVRSTSNCGS